MRNNTPPSSPFFERSDMNEDDNENDDGDDELIYVGDADGKQNLWHSTLNLCIIDMISFIEMFIFCF